MVLFGRHLLEQFQSTAKLSLKEEYSALSARGLLSLSLLELARCTYCLRLNKLAARHPSRWVKILNQD